MERIGHENVPVTRNQKDTVFRMLFREKRELLSLYNAVNDTTYDRVEDLEITTLENAVYMSMKNDISCILDMRLQLYEHQSTVSENIPLRDLMYVARQYEKRIIHKDIYRKKKIKLPTPRFIVFYNGVEKQPERKTYRLSDAFEIPEQEPQLELVVLQLNINRGYNAHLMEKCPTLFEYMEYVETIRKYRRQTDLDQAVRQAVEECIRRGILKDFLLRNKAEVISMTIFEYDEELHLKTLYEEGVEDGIRQGIERGMERGMERGIERGIQRGIERGETQTLISIVCRMIKKGNAPQEIADILEEDISKIEAICDVAKEYAPEYDEEAVYEKLSGRLNKIC